MTAAISLGNYVEVTAASAALAGFAGLLADKTRASFCLALLDGRAWTSGELARHAGVAASTTSAHITMLVAGGILVDEHQGRHRYVRIADSTIAAILEDLVSHVGIVDKPTSLKESARAAAMSRARTCYDHLAGRLGVSITDAMYRHKLLTDSGFALTKPGEAWLAGLDIDVDELRASRRPLVRPCLDWTERRFHVAGAGGAALCELAMNRKWVERIGTGRALKVTTTGERALRDLLGLEPGELKSDGRKPLH